MDKSTKQENQVTGKQSKQAKTNNEVSKSVALQPLQLKSATVVSKGGRVLGSVAGSSPNGTFSSSSILSKQMSTSIGGRGSHVTGRGPVLSTAKYSPMPGLDSIDSIVSIGFSEGSANASEMEGSGTLVIRDGPELYSRILGTAVGFAIRCPHGKMPLVKVKEHVGYWLPYAYVPDGAKLLDTAADVSAFFQDDALKFAEQKAKAGQTTATGGAPTTDSSSEKQKTATNQEKQKPNVNLLSNFQLFSNYRFQIPNGKVITRYIYLAQWSAPEGTVTSIPQEVPKQNTPTTPVVSCCSDTSNVQWVSIEGVVAEMKQLSSSSYSSISSSSPPPLLEHLWGYEVVLVAPTLQSMHSGSLLQFMSPTLQEFSNVEVMKYLSRARQNHSTASFCQMLHEAKFTEADVIKIYCDYVQHCFPSATMTYCSFYEYFTKIGFLQFDDGSLRNVFRAMNFKNKHHMLFNEFLLGLAALDSNVPNSKLRFTYIFRYYDRNGDGFLDSEDFKRLVGDIRLKANLSVNPAELEKDVKSRLAIMKHLKSEDKGRISYKAFLNEAVNISGIVHLFRTNKAILEAIHSRNAYDLIVNPYGKSFGRFLVGSCARCRRPKKYSLSYHAVRLNVQGRVDEPRALISLLCGELDKELHYGEKAANQLELKHSTEVVFNEASVANKVLTIVRKMADFHKMEPAQQKEVRKTVTAGLTVDLIRKLCKEVIAILQLEPRLLKVNSPVFVLGDIHGNVEDLLTYEEQLWPLAPTANSPNVLALGNYVGRGDHGIESACYLFAQKVLAPTKFFFLRGNHEIRDVQKKYTFYQECKSKYGKSTSDTNTVFEAFNVTFDHLPLAAVIDEAIFCSHGGIPSLTTKLESIFKIPCPLVDPYAQSKIAWEMLWSDPITNAQHSEITSQQNSNNQQPNDLFLPNSVRGNSYFFTEKALQKFLKANELSHVIRGHEFILEGFRFYHSGQLISVFSSSRHCGYPNRPACVFVDSRDTEGFIKVISLDT